MLKVNSIRNVQNTINNKRNQINFTSGVQTNFGADVIKASNNSKHEAGFLTDFLGTIKQSPMFFNTFFQRQASIEKSLNTEQKFNAIA